MTRHLIAEWLAPKPLSCCRRRDIGRNQIKRIHEDAFRHLSGVDRSLGIRLLERLALLLLRKLYWRAVNLSTGKHSKDSGRLHSACRDTWWDCMRGLLRCASWRPDGPDPAQRTALRAEADLVSPTGPRQRT